MCSLWRKTLNGNVDSIVAVLVRVLEVIFIAGLLGSSVVLILTLLEDAKSLMPGDKSEGNTQVSPRGPQLRASDPIA